MSEESSSVALVAVAKPEESPARTSYMESLKFLGLFADRVAALDADAWQRISERCATLNGSSFEALIERAALFASQSGVGMIEPRSFGVALVTNSMRVAMATFALGREAALEFEPQSAPAEAPIKTGHPAVDLGLEADWKIASALNAHVPGQRGVAVAMDAAAHAVKMLRVIPGEPHLVALYAFIEPEIPFASLEAQYKAMRELEGKSGEDAARAAQRTADVDRFVRFVDRLESLSPEAWQRINESCARLNDDSFGALLDRVAFSTRSIGARQRRIARRESMGRATTVVIHTFVAATAFVNEITREFDPRREPAGLSADRLARLTPERGRSVDAFNRMHRVLREQAPNQRGTGLAIAAAAQAVQRKRSLTDEEIAELYSAVAAEIPFDELDHD